MYLPALRSDISQGDIFENVSLLSIAEIAYYYSWRNEAEYGRTESWKLCLFQLLPPN